MPRSAFVLHGFCSCMLALCGYSGLLLGQFPGAHSCRLVCFSLGSTRWFGVWPLCSGGQELCSHPFLCATYLGVVTGNQSQHDTMVRPCILSSCHLTSWPVRKMQLSDSLVTKSTFLYEPLLHCKSPGLSWAVFHVTHLSVLDVTSLMVIRTHVADPLV